MFVQVIQGQLADPDLLRRQVETWRRDIKPGAHGYLGSTSGVTPDGQAIVLVRFESPAAAEANSSRTEQGAWWNETAKAFAGDVTFHDSQDVDTILGGGSDQAGFVQVMQGRAKDKDGMRRGLIELSGTLRSRRPDILGIVVAWHGEREFTQAVYFKSEAETRQLEKETAQDPDRQRFGSFIDGELRFFDLTEPDLD
jgi:hypothetical protein